MQQQRSEIREEVDKIFENYKEGKIEEMIKNIERIIEILKNKKYTALRKHYDLFLAQLEKYKKDESSYPLWKCYIMAKYDEGRKQGGLKGTTVLSTFLEKGIKKVEKGEINTKEFKQIYEMFIALSRSILKSD